MPAPRHVFLDTSVFDEQSYNFSSQAFTSLVEASKASPLTLIIPKPTEDEIRRHIPDRATEAIRVLEDAGRKAPFLRKWDQWPLRKDEGHLKYHLLGLARKEYDLFKEQFSVVQLDYSENSLTQIMAWYEQGRAPFGPRKKKNEFPDAIALCSLLSYARTKEVHVGVLSLDNDFRDACAFHTDLLFFGSIPALTEALLGEESISDDFAGLAFFPTEDPSGEVAEVEVQEIDIDELNAINLGDGEATVAFDATVTFSAHVSFDDHEAGFEYGHRGWHPANRRAGTVSASAPISGTAKIAMNADWSAIARIVLVSIETEEVSVDGVPDVDVW
jgi:PIN domain